MPQDKINKVVGDFVIIGLLQKFLNDPNRLGMTEQEQKDRIDSFEQIGNQLSEKLEAKK